MPISYTGCPLISFWVCGSIQLKPFTLLCLVFCSVFSRSKSFDQYTKTHLSCRSPVCMSICRFFMNLMYAWPEAQNLNYADDLKFICYNVFFLGCRIRWDHWSLLQTIIWVFPIRLFFMVPKLCPCFCRFCKTTKPTNIRWIYIHTGERQLRSLIIQ